MRLVDLDTGNQFCRIDYLPNGKVLIHIQGELPNNVTVMNGKGGAEYAKRCQLKGVANESV